ncbi:MAG: 30S ribosomal protein S18 [Clostridiales bacterium]|nr:30S ribosomal protein S18 [Clostridiales bacterium]
MSTAVNNEKENAAATNGAAAATNGAATATNGAAAATNGAAEDKSAKRRPIRRIPRKKVCAFCVEKVDEINYKDVSRLKKFITEKGKIIPRRMSGTCARHQRQLAQSIKRARVMALIPFIGE